MNPFAWEAVPCSAYLLLYAVVFAGCASLENRQPIDEDLVIARQLSQQGMDAMLSGNWVAAESRFRNAVRYSPRDHVARGKYAECLWQRGEHERALDQVKRAIDHSDGEDPRLIVTFGEMLFPGWSS